MAEDAAAYVSSSIYYVGIIRVIGILRIEMVEFSLFIIVKDFVC